MSQDDRLGELEAFAAVARTLSFTSASRHLDVPVSSISRRVKKLEKRLGVRLVERTTRRVQLTAAGRVFLPECIEALGAYIHATERLTRNEASLSGCIRVSLPNSFGRNQIVPLIPAFARRYPDIDLDLAFSDRLVDLAAEGFDLGIRIVAPGLSSEAVRPLGTNRRLLCAAPEYLSRFPTPTHPAQLSQHRCLGFSPLLGGDAWTFTRGNVTETVEIRARYRASDADAVRALAIAGEGIAIQAEFNATADIAAGRLRRILVAWSLPLTSIVAQVANARFVPRRVEVFIEYVRKSLPRYLRR
jgi:DNA-binding transcriptional LysR family regulator